MLKRLPLCESLSKNRCAILPEQRDFRYVTKDFRSGGSLLGFVQNPERSMVVEYEKKQYQEHKN